MTTATAAASDALARLDDGLQDPDDAELAAVLDLHCQTAAFVPPAFCRHGQGPDCNNCFLDDDALMRRAEDQ